MQSQQSSSRPLALHLLLEALAGCVLGLLCGALAGFVAARLFAGSSGGWGDVIGALLGSIGGYTLGVSLGVWAAGRHLHSQGPYWLSLVGSVAGALLVLLLAEPLRLSAIPWLLQSAVVVIVPLAAAFTFHMGPRR